MGDNEYEELVPNDGNVPDAPADAPPAAPAKAAASSKAAGSTKVAGSKKVAGSANAAAPPKAAPASKPASAVSGSSAAINTPGTPGTPGPPTHAIPSVDFKPVELAPLRDDDINLNSNPISGPTGANGSKKEVSKKDETVTGSKIKDPPKEENSSTKKEDKKKKKKRSKKNKKSSRGSKEPEKISNGPVIGFLVSFILFCVGIGLAVFVAGHKWFGVKAIEAIVH